MNPDNRHGAAPTIRDIASAAELSAATVSLALRGHPKIPPATRARVVALAASLGYRPNPLVTSLMRQIRTGRQPSYQGTLAFLHIDQPRGQILSRSGYFQALHQGVVKQADRHGYRVETFWIEKEKTDCRRLTSILRAREVRGILVPPLPDARALTGIDWSYFSAVALTHSLLSPRMHRVCPNQFDNMGLLLRNLKESGYRRVGFYLDRLADHRVNRFWSSAFLRYQLDLPAGQRIPLLLTEEIDVGAFHRWHKRHKPDVIICPFSEITQWVADSGCRIPEDVGLAMPSSDWSNQAISHIDECPEQVGADAADILIMEISCDNRGIPQSPRTHSVCGEWRQGSTTRNIR